jgi:signal transduction histidine kinase
MSFGIEGMRERASLLNGAFTMNLNNSLGTSIAVRIPLTSNANNKVK